MSKKKTELFGEHFPEASSLLYNMVMVYSRLLDLGQQEEAEKVLKQIEDRATMPHLKKLKASLQELAQQYNLSIPGLDQEDVTKWSKPFLDSRFISAQKIKNQLSLFSINDRENIELTIQSGIDGIELDLYQERAFDGILHKFSELDYPKFIQLTESEFYELAGADKILTRRKKHEFPGYETKRLKKALKTLDDTKYPMIVKQFAGYDKKNKNNRWNVMRVNQSLVNLGWCYKGVMGEELREYEKELATDKNNSAHEKIKQRFSCWRIYLNPFVMADIQKSFRVLPHNVYKKIKEHKKLSNGDTSKTIRVISAEILFIKWLHKHGKGKTEIRINWLTLARDLKFSRMIEDRQYRKLRNAINDLYRLAKELGYLTGYQVNVKTLFTQDKTVDILYLDPEKFYHL